MIKIKFNFSDLNAYRNKVQTKSYFRQWKKMKKELTTKKKIGLTKIELKSKLRDLLVA